MNIVGLLKTFYHRAKRYSNELSQIVPRDLPKVWFKTEDTVLQNEPEQFSVLPRAEKCESKKGTLKFSHSLKRNGGR